MLSFSRLFFRHYFSNHYTEALSAEKKFSRETSEKHSVAFSNLETLVIATHDELKCDGVEIDLCDSSLQFLAWVNRLNRVLERTGRDTFDITERRWGLAEREFFYPRLTGLLSPSFVLQKDGVKVGRIYDLGKSAALLKAGAIITTPSDRVAEKLRWARSSYGREGNAEVNIAGNGRFSEFQGRVLRGVLDKDGGQ